MDTMVLLMMLVVVGALCLAGYVAVNLDEVETTRMRERH